MSKISTKELNSFSNKMLRIRRKGLKSYLKYLENQLDLAGNKKSKKAYANYTKEQIKDTKKKIKKITRKLG